MKKILGDDQPDAQAEMYHLHQNQAQTFPRTARTPPSLGAPYKFVSMDFGDMEARIFSDIAEANTDYALKHVAEKYRNVKFRMEKGMDQIDIEVNVEECLHESKEYIGFTESYTYCTKCNTKL
jgi:hypothetical protein